MREFYIRYEISSREMEMEREMEKGSEEIKRLLDFIRRSDTLYKMAFEAVRVEDKRTQDLLHAIEFVTSSKEQRRIGAKLRDSRRTRRRNKDIVEELEPIINFFSEPQNKRTLDKMSQLLGAVRKEEKYHEDRVYHPRVEDD